MDAAVQGAAPPAVQSELGPSQDTRDQLEVLRSIDGHLANLDAFVAGVGQTLAVMMPTPGSKGMPPNPFGRR